MSALLVAIDQMFSMRELSKLNKNAKPFIQMLTTSTIGTVLPQFTEEYGADKKIDVVVSPSHALFLDGLPNSKISGIYVDKNGNWKVRLNMNIQVNLEQSEDQWIPVRNIYATFVFTFKATMDQKDPSNKKVVMLPKRIELSAIKVMKDDEEMSMEQMMIQSMASIQFEQAQKMFREIPIPVGDIMAKNPAELQCFGFNIADLDISYKKSQAQFTAYYKTIEEPDKDICDAFKKELQKTPKKILEQMKGGDDSPFQKGLKKFAQLGHNEMMKDAEADKLKREREKTAEYMKSDL